MSKKRVVHVIPGMEATTVRRGEPYKVTDAGTLTMDLYYPPDATPGVRRPAVLFVTGFSDAGAELVLGAKFKDMGSFVSWAQLVAASGLVAITYENSQPADVHDLLDHVQKNATTLGIDEERLAVWACSGHGPHALAVLMEYGRDRLACAALVYPYTLDPEGSTVVADAAKQFRFVNTAAGKSARDLPKDLPLIIVRAGQDKMPGLNQALDAFVAATLALNLPVTVVNYASGPHAFDVFDDSRPSRAIVKDTLSFLQFHLAADPTWS